MGAATAAALLTMLAVQPVHGQTAPTSPRGRRAATQPFRVEEASIADLHRAIQQGRTTCSAVVRAYVERAQAYNGACT